MKRVKLFTTSAFLVSLLSTNIYAAKDMSLKNDSQDTKSEVNTEYGKIHIGFEGGIAVPAAKGFTDKITKTKVSMKRSPIFSGLLGYEFAPNMYLQASASHRPNFKLGIKLSEPSPKGKTKAKVDMYMLSLAYDLPELGNEKITPYVILGAGLAKVKVKTTSIIHSTAPNNLVLLKTLKKTSNSFAWQAGLGLSTKIVENLKLQASARLIVINNVRLHYSKLTNSNPYAPEYQNGKMKKTIGAGEFLLGLTYALPF